MKPPRHIGSVAVSAEGAALCYRTICSEAAASLGTHNHPQITMHQTVIRKMGERGCDAVVLGCTEIPLLISDADSPLPALDSTRILARAALRETARDPRLQTQTLLSVRSRDEARAQTGVSVLHHRPLNLEPGASIGIARAQRGHAASSYVSRSRASND